MIDTAMLQKQKVPNRIRFFISGMYPLIICMILGGFVPYLFAFIAGIAVGVSMIILLRVNYWMARRDYMLVATTSLLLLLAISYSIAPQIIPQGTLTVTLYAIVTTLSAIYCCFYVKLERYIQKRNDPEMSLANQFAVTQTLTLLVLAALYFLVITVCLIFVPDVKERMSFVLFHLLPPFFLFPIVYFNPSNLWQFLLHVHPPKRMLSLVNEQGDVIGKSTQKHYLESKEENIYPLIRIVIVCEGMIFLQKITGKMRVEQGKIDTPLETPLPFGETLDGCAKQLMEDAFSEDEADVDLRFNIKYRYRNGKRNDLVYLYLALSTQQVIDNSDELDGGKLWTIQQIEYNLGKGLFSTCFEKEFEHLKFAIEIMQEYQLK